MKTACVLVVLLSGCGFVTDLQFEHARILCEAHKGVAWVDGATYSTTVAVKCKDGAYIKKTAIDWSAK